ncbi:MAG: outer membrane protein assembly factor BamB family protein [Anaerolineae bacterium]
METLKLQPEQRGQQKVVSATLPIGTILQGRYQILKVIGLGGMGAVYQVRDRHFQAAQRLCALKEMIVNVNDPSKRRLAAQIFEREANILATLSHPSIPKIHDYFTHEDRHYLVLEFVEGMDLEAVLRVVRTPLPAERVVDWAIQICDVLTYLHCHEPSIVFRDLKPSNIMVRPSNRVVLVDFGIARTINVGDKGTMIGTEGYSPPEQYRGIASPQGDIYALGATMHHLLTRRDPRLHPPFSFSEEPPSRVNPSVSKELEAIIMRALEYDPTARYSSAEEMKAALLRCCAISETSAEAAASLHAPTSVDTRSDSKASAPKPQASQGVPAVTTYSVVPIWRFRCEDEVRSSPVVADGVLYVGCYDNNLYALNAKTGEFLWKYATEGGIAATPCVWKDRVLFGSEDRFFYAVSIRSGRILWTCPTEGRIRSSARVELEHVFFGSDDRRLYAVNAHNGQVVWRFEALEPIRSSPAVGDEMVYVGSDDHHLYAIDLQAGRQRWKFRANRNIISSPVLHGGLVVFGSMDWNVYALDERSGWSVWRFRTNHAVVGSPRIMDEVVYIGSVDGYLYALELDNGRLVWKFNTGSQVVSTPAVTEKSVYVSTLGGDIISINRKTGKEQWRFSAEGPMPSSPYVYEETIYVGSNDHCVYALPA